VEATTLSDIRGSLNDDDPGSDDRWPNPSQEERTIIPL